MESHLATAAVSLCFSDALSAARGRASSSWGPAEAAAAMAWARHFEAAPTARGRAPAAHDALGSAGLLGEPRGPASVLGALLRNPWLGKETRRWAVGEALREGGDGGGALLMEEARLRASVEMLGLAASSITSPPPSSFGSPSSPVSLSSSAVSSTSSLGLRARLLRAALAARLRGGGGEAAAVEMLERGRLAGSRRSPWLAELALAALVEPSEVKGEEGDDDDMARDTIERWLLESGAFEEACDVGGGADDFGGGADDVGGGADDVGGGADDGGGGVDDVGGGADDVGGGADDDVGGGVDDVGGGGADDVGGGDGGASCEVKPARDRSPHSNSTRQLISAQDRAPAQQQLRRRHMDPRPGQILSQRLNPSRQRHADKATTTTTTTSRHANPQMSPPQTEPRALLLAACAQRPRLREFYLERLSGHVASLRRDPGAHGGPCAGRWWTAAARSGSPGWAELRGRFAELLLPPLLPGPCHSELREAAERTIRARRARAGALPPLRGLDPWEDLARELRLDTSTGP